MTLRAIFVLSLALFATPVWAQAAKTAEDPVIARVNGTDIHRSALFEAIQGLPPQAQQQPDIGQKVLNNLVLTTLASQAARAAKMQDDPEVKKRLAAAQNEVIANVYMQRIAEKGITDQKLHADYDKFVKSAPPREEISARHILLTNEADAKAAIEELKKGADFAKLAGEKTTDPTGKTSGGDLGYFTKDEMVPEFADAAFKLKKGEYTQTPVKTQFGWHVIKVEDRRTAPPPSFDQVKPQLANQVGREVVNAKLKELETKAKIEIFNLDGSKPGAAPAPAAGAPAGAPTGAPAAAGAPTLAPATAPQAAPPTLSPATKQ